MVYGRTSIRFALAILCVLAMARTAHARDDAAPSVEIDRSVIMELPHTVISPGTKRMVLRPPRQGRPMPEPYSKPPVPRASLTAPYADSLESEQPSYDPADAPLSVPIPIPKRRPSFTEDNSGDNDDQSDGDGMGNSVPVQLKRFPVVTKTRSDSSDPSLPGSSPAPLLNAVSGDVAKGLAAGEQSESIPIAGQKKKKSVKGAVAAREVPPDQRHRAAGPDGSIMILQPENGKAPATLKKKSTYAVRDQKLKGVPVMPAMPAPTVIGTPMLDGQSEDELLQRMMEMEKHQVMTGIEDVVKRTNTPSKIPMKAAEPGKTFIHVEPIIKKPETAKVIPSPAPPAVNPVPVPKKIVKPAEPEKTIVMPTQVKKNAALPMPTPIATVKPAEPPAKSAKTQAVKTIATVKPQAVQSKSADKKKIVILPENAKAPKEEKVATTPPSGPLSVPYDASQISMNPKLQKQIDAKIVPMLKKDRALRVQIQAFASEIAQDKHTSRQRSLARGLAVRAYLLGLGIEPERLDVRAMGSQSDIDPLDRIDFVPMPQGGNKQL